MTEVFIKNFQSIKDLHFKIDGFTVLIGKNNIGKSAIVRAISSALNNEAEKNYLRLGEKQMEVRIARPDIDFTWTKGDSASYSITEKGKDTEKFSKLNGAVPEPLIKYGFDKISIDDKMVSPLIAKQFEEIFLLDKRGSVITEVLTALYDMDTLNIADEKCQKELKANKSLLKTREGDLKSLQAKLEKYRDFEKIKEAVAKIVEKELEGQLLQKEIDLILGFERDIEDIQNRISRLEPTASLDVPKTGTIENLIPDYQWVSKSEEELINISSIVKKLKEIVNITIPDTKEISDLIPDLRWAQEKEQEIEHSLRAVNGLKTIEGISIPDIDRIKILVEEVQGLASIDDEMINLNNSIDRQKEVKNIDTDALEESIKKIEHGITDYTEIADQEQQLITQATSAKTIRDDLKKIMEDLDSKNKEFSAINICPLCERPMHD